MVFIPLHKTEQKDHKDTLIRPCGPFEFRRVRHSFTHILENTTVRILCPVLFHTPQSASEQ